MAAKVPIFHPYTTNTGQVLLSDLVVYPGQSHTLLFTAGGGGLPVVPLDLGIEDVGEGLVLLVYSDTSLVVGMDFVPTPITDGTAQVNTILLAGGHYHLLQWPSTFFTPVPVAPVTDDSYVFINLVLPQNSIGDAYKLDNR